MTLQLTKMLWALLGLIPLLVAASGCGGPEPLMAMPDYPWLGSFNWHDKNHVTWSADSSRIFYSIGAGIYVIDVENGSKQVIADPVVTRGTYKVHPGLDTITGGPMTYFDVSPDGTMIAYSTCRYHNGPTDADKWGVGHLCKEGYEIVTANIDGSDVRRITNNTHLDNFPAWSPSGRHLAYIADKLPLPPVDEYVDARSSPLDDNKLHKAELLRSSRWGVTGRLMVRDMATGRSRDVTRSLGDRVAGHPLVWSPNGERIAFVAYEDHDYNVAWLRGSEAWQQGAEWAKALVEERQETVVRRRVVFTVKPDGSSLKRVSDALSEPAWSPDGRRLLIAVPDTEDGVGVHLYTFAPDGSDPQLVREVSVTWGRVQGSPPFWLGTVHWSPDGSLVMFTNPRELPTHLTGREESCWLCLASPDGGPALEAASLPTVLSIPFRYSHELISDISAFSHDGSRIAVLPRGQYQLLYTVDRQGKDPRIYLPLGEAGRPKAKVLKSCTNDISADNPGLIEDCRILLESRYALGGDVLYFWNPYSPMTRWGPIRYGETETTWIELGGSPPRVVAVVVKTERNSHGEGPRLFGQVPRVLSGLTNLEVLDLSGTALHQAIPSELGNLANLRSLVLERNYLSGPIPPELGDLTALETLDLSMNALTGNIPPELGSLANLETLDLSGNGLTGSVPPELGNLVNLRELDLSNTAISGPIPAELAKLENLEKLVLSGTDSSVCVPAELKRRGVIWHFQGSKVC